jgi:hypothetical protein
LFAVLLSAILLLITLDFPPKMVHRIDFYNNPVSFGHVIWVSLAGKYNFMFAESCP